MSNNPSRETVDGLTRVNSAKIWPSFYGNTMSMELDVWLDDRSEEKQDSLADIFNTQLSDERLKFVMEHCHYKLKHDDLNDNWLKNSCLGSLLDNAGFKILAVVERVRSFNFETMMPAMKCSILVGNKNPPQTPLAPE